MQSKTIIFVALIAVAFSSENVSEKKSDEKLDEKVDVDTKKDKRGLWDLGYGYNTYGVNSYGIRSGLGLTTYSTYSEPAAYSVYPASHTHTVITKEIGVPVEKHIYPVRHVSYPTVKVAVPVVHQTYSLPVPSYAQPIVIQKNSGWAPASSYSSW